MLGAATRDCTATMRPWQALARREEHQLPAQASEFYSQLGRCQRHAGEYDAARVMFERSLALRRDPLDERCRHRREPRRPRRRARRRRRERAARSANCATRWRSCSSKVGERHPLAIDILRSLCSLQRAQGDTPRRRTQLPATRWRWRSNCRARSIAPPSTRAGSWRRCTSTRAASAKPRREFSDSQAWLLARLGMEHDDVARNYNSLAIVAWERNDIAAALRDLDHAIAISRKPGNAQLLAGPAVQPRDDPARHRPRCRGQAAAAGSAAPAQGAARAPRTALVGDTLRLLGEVQRGAGRTGDGATATAAGGRADAQRLRRHRIRTRCAANCRWRDSRRATATPAALQQLERLGSLAENDIELRKVAWLARAYLAERDCHGPQRKQALDRLAALDLALRQAQPEGGSVVARDRRDPRRAALKPAAP